MNSIQKITSEEDIIANKLKKLIAKRKKSLMRLADKVEQLKIDLQLIEEEYEGRIGNLYKKDTLLDLEIIRFQKINELMDKGVSFEDAVMELDEKLKEEEYTYEDIQDYISLPKTQALTEDAEIDIKKLWKKLVHKFHPDLSQNKSDKEKRELIMKTINNAYANKDYGILKTIQEKELIEDVEVETLERLEKVYVDIQNAIARCKSTLKDLRLSQWFSWIAKTKEEKEALLSEMESHIAQDVTMKEVFLRSLKRKYNNL